MRYFKKFAFLILGFVVGALLGGFVVHHYMLEFGVDWNQWAASMDQEGKAAAALSKVAVLESMQSGDLVKARYGLEMGLGTDTVELSVMKRAGQDPHGSTTKALLKIRAYRLAHPWSSGLAELDKGVADDLSRALDQTPAKNAPP